MYFQLLLLALIINTADTNLPCAPGEVTKPYIFTYTFSNNYKFVTWRKNDKDIVSCAPESNCVVFPILSENYEARVSGQTAYLTIKAVTTQSSGNYTCIVEVFSGLSELFSCLLRVYETNLPCAPGEVTKPYTFTYNFSNNYKFVTWNKNDEDIVSCAADSDCIVFDDSEARVSGQTAYLTIKAVTTQSSGNYTCIVEVFSGLSESFSCLLRVYAKPNAVTCQDPEFQTETREVAAVCTVLRVYPSPVCQFSWIIDNIENRTIQKSLVEYSNMTGSGDPSYFNQKCSFKIPARNFTRGKHQFQLLAYPDVTGQVIDTVYGKNSSQTAPKYVADPNVTLVCSKTSIQEGKQFSCTCNETANTFILPTTTLFYGAAMVSSALQQVTADVTARRNTLELFCQAELPDGTKASKTQTVQVYFGPTIFIVEANNNSGQTIVEKNSGVSISCQAEGNPSPRLSLKMDGREIQPFNVSTDKSNQTLTYHKVMADCMDTGVYTCHAETGQAATDKTVTVYVKCAQQFRYPDSLSQSFQEQVNGTVLINVPIFGYPEPTVTLTSNKYTLASESYNLNYIKHEPPYGTVSLVINIRNASFFQNYSLNINNSEGELTYSFEIMEGVESGSEKGDSPSVDIGAIVGGIVAAVLVIIIIFVIVCLVKRKGAPCSRKKDQYANNSMHTIYENGESANNRAANADMDSRDIRGSRRVLEDIPEATVTENPHYEEIIDFRSDMPEKSVYYENQISNALDGEVEYENTVIGL